MSRTRLALTLTVLAAAVPVGALPSTTAAAPSVPAAKKKCHPNYKGVCLKRNASDYDCAGGSGNGPYYVRGPVRVVGSDPVDLDRDGDGVGCD